MKFLNQVDQITFSGPFAAEMEQPVLYVTERCVFQNTTNGLELIEVAPGIDIESDILAHMEFEPIIGEVRSMDARIFIDKSMNLKADVFEAPLEDRIRLDRKNNTLEFNFRGLTISHNSQLSEIDS